MLNAYTFFICLLLGRVSPLFAQSIFVSENQLFTVGEGTTIFLESTLTNDGFISNQGSIQVAGDWINRQSYAGAGSVSFMGTEEQRIEHNDQSFATFIAEGGGLKRLVNSVTVTDQLILSQGLIETSSENIMQLSSEATVEGAGAFSYILGPVVCLGTGYRYFPIGTETEFLPLVLEDVLGIAPTIQAQVISPNPNPAAGEKLERVSERHYWLLEEKNGSFDGSLVTLPVYPDDAFESLIGVVVAQTDQVGSSFTSLGQSNRLGNQQEGWVTSELLATQSIFALGLTTEYSLENTIAVPSAFAPDALSSEDQRLKVYAANLLPSSFMFTIFNRWGQVVYETNVLSEALSEGWNGTHFQTNEPLPVGVYHYVLRGIFESNQAVEQTGAITLFR